MGAGDMALPLVGNRDLDHGRQNGHLVIREAETWHSTRVTASSSTTAPARRSSDPGGGDRASPWWWSRELDHGPGKAVQ